MSRDKAKYPYTWEEAIEVLRRDPKHQDLVFDAYLTDDLRANCLRFHASREFLESLSLLRQYAPGFQSVLDMPGGNGIATFAFAKSGYEVTVVEPDPSASVGRGAIAHVLAQEGLNARIVAAVGESLPFSDESFDVAYVRQGLHHARDLRRMVGELSRVLKPRGVLLAAREHVVDNYGESLREFLDSQVDHQLYGGEHAFTLDDYKGALASSGLKILREIGPYDSAINMYPNDDERLRAKILRSVPGRLLRAFLPSDVIVKIGAWRLRSMNSPGRLFSFLSQKAV